MHCSQREEMTCDKNKEKYHLLMIISWSNTKSSELTS